MAEYTALCICNIKLARRSYKDLRIVNTVKMLIITLNGHISVVPGLTLIIAEACNNKVAVSRFFFTAGKPNRPNSSVLSFCDRGYALPLSAALQIFIVSRANRYLCLLKTRNGRIVTLIIAEPRIFGFFIGESRVFIRNFAHNPLCE